MKTSLSLLALALVPALGFTFAGVADVQAAGEKGAEETIDTEKIDGGHICGPFPNVSWWVNDPAKILRLVKKRYKGDWDTYIASWNRYGGSLQRNLENGEARVIKSQGKTLRGPTLAVHVAMVKKRVAVLTCLRDTEISANKLEMLETAAGGNNEKPQPGSSENAALRRCDELPQVDWWSKTRAAVKGAVAKRYNGDWNKYIKRWKVHYASMKRSFENQQPRIVKSRGITLRGKTLEAHLGKIEKRIEVLECMRGQAEAVVLESAEKTGSSSIADFYGSRLAHYFAAPRNMRLHLQGSRRATFARQTDIDIMTRYLDDQEMVYADRLRRLVERKDQLDYAHALQTVLKVWLFVHIPATYGLILLAMLHLLLAYSFGGAR